MNAKARTARQIIKSRRQGAKQNRAGLHTVTSHALRAGVDAKDAAGIGNAVRAKAKTLGVTGCQAHMMRKAAKGSVPVKGGRRYTRTELARMLAGYNPRAAKYVAAKALLVAYVGA